MSIRVYCAKKERETPKSVFHTNKTFPKGKKRNNKVELMNNTRSYICIQLQMTSTTHNDRSSNNVVKTRKTFRWNNKKNKKEDFLCIAKREKNNRCFILYVLTHIV